MIKINFFANILSFVINPIYGFVKDYGLAVILFTLVIKVILFPLGVKQQQTTVKTKKIRPELQKIQAKYKNDKQKLNEETMKLYQQYGINPMGGCLPLLIQLPILLGLYRVIQAPMTWILRKTPTFYLEKMIEDGTPKEKVMEILTKLAGDVDITGLTEIKDIVFKISEKARDFEIKLASELDIIDFNFLGMDLSKAPSEDKLLLIVVALATGAAFFSNWVTKKISAMPEEQAQQMKMMNLMMPLMTAFFTYTLPAGIGMYWFASTMFSVLQMVILTKYYDKKYANDDFLKKDKKGKNK